MIYLDWASTTPMSEMALDAYRQAALAFPANPSSLHAGGKAAAAFLLDCRERLSLLLACRKERLIFTSGGTESDSIPFLSLLRRVERGSVVISAIEHPAVEAQARTLERAGYSLRFVRPGDDGRVRPEAFASACGKDTVLASCMAVNNETGAIQPVGEIAALSRAAAGTRLRFHCDAVQALGKIPFFPEAIGVDSAAYSAHKIRGPRGVGALFLGRPLDALASGGGQEGGIRPGTENLPGIASFAAAAADSLETLQTAATRVTALMSRLLAGLHAIPGATPLPTDRALTDDRFSPWITSISFPGLRGEVMLRLLSDDGIAVSTGSACASSKKGRRVLDAMGVEEALSASAIRVSLGSENSEADIDALLDASSCLYRRYKV